MTDIEGATLRESLRQLVRHLGVLEKSDTGEGGISLAQCHALVEIGRDGKANLNELAQRMHVDKSTMSRTIEQLVRAGIAMREPDETDRRYVVIRLSKTGQHLFERTEHDMDTYFQRIFMRIASEKRQQVLQSLALLNEAIMHDAQG
jgi:DNA-binding MarR family transcriptional regulator